MTERSTRIKSKVQASALFLASALLLPAAASAADLPDEPLPPQITYYDTWSGFYGGVSAGIGHFTGTAMD